MLLAIFWSRIVLPVRGGATITPRWPKPSGVTRSTTRMLISSLVVSSRIRPWGCSGVRSSKQTFSLSLSGSSKLIASTRKQREVALVFLGRPDLARDDGAGLEPEAANLAGRDIDVVGAGEVVVVGAAQEAEAVGQDLERALAVHEAVLLDPLFQDLEDQVLLLEPHVLDDAFALGRADQLRHRHLLKLGEMDLAALDVFVAIVERGVAEDVFLFVGKSAGRSVHRRKSHGAGRSSSRSAGA